MNSVREGIGWSWGRTMVVAVHEHWLGSFLLNLLAYGLIIFPAALLIRRWKKSELVQKGQGRICATLRLLVFGDTLPQDSLGKTEEGGAVSKTASPEPMSELSTSQYYMKLILCICGLQVPYLIWGILQERVMTRTYDGERFSNSQFLVFVNRVLAMVVAGFYILLTRQPRHTAPFYKYSYSSISNTLSSWCQYEALKFVSFPTQVLAKASKVIPVMLMGKVVSNRTYAWHEYLTASMMSAGVALFLLSTTDPAAKTHTSTEITFAVIIILLGYVVFDSFTSNWQSELFRTYKISSVQAMFGVNLFSCIFTMGSLLLRGALFSSISFLSRHMLFAFHTALLSLCSAIGQLFIFYTINTFGPLIFTLISTSRQAISVFVSQLIYAHTLAHTLTLQGMIGVGVVFVALFLRAYFQNIEKKGSK